MNFWVTFDLPCDMYGNKCIRFSNLKMQDESMSECDNLLTNDRDKMVWHALDLFHIRYVVTPVMKFHHLQHDFPLNPPIKTWTSTSLEKNPAKSRFFRCRRMHRSISRRSWFLPPRWRRVTLWFSRRFRIPGFLVSNTFTRDPLDE